LGLDFRFSERESQNRNRQLLDYFVGPSQDVRWNRQADLLGCFEIDNELELSRPFNGKISGLGAFKDFVDVDGGALENFVSVSIIRCEAANFDN
jgi:hypothetical protein